MVKKLLFKNQSKMQLSIAVLGAFIGFTFLISSIHYLNRIKEFGKAQEILGKETVIIQRKVSTLSTLNLAKTDFDEDYVAYIKSQNFVENTHPVINNNFDISIQTDSDLLPYMRSDIFIQSVNKEFLRETSLEWSWKKGDAYVPVILPQDFMVMLNSFASAKGLPKLSEDLVKSLNFKFVIGDGKRSEGHTVRIYGFTNEIASVLVPESFMEYGNVNYPVSGASPTVSQLIVSIKEGKFGVFEKFMEENGLETKESSLVIGKLKSVAQILLSVLLGIGIITICLAVLILIQYAQLLVSRNQYEIRTLLRIGYNPRKIVRVLTGYFARLFLGIILISMLVFVGLKWGIDSLFLQYGIQIDTGFTVGGFVVAFFVFLAYVLINFMNAKREILKTR